MQIQTYEVDINASKPKVWEVLWNEETYCKWTSAFAAESSVKSDWQEGSRILFLDGKGGGMYSVIEKKETPDTMVFKHLGEYKDGVEIPFAADTGWANSIEKYVLTEEEGKTKVKVEIDVDDNYLEFMNKTFPKALGILKELAEA